MKLSVLLEGRKLLAVVYGGRFQPFHKGHYSVYKELCKQFGKGAVWIATSNKTNFNPSNGDVSPFTFDERAEIMTQMFGISPDKIIKCKNPAFAPVEVLELYKAPVVCVMVAGDKDVERYSSSDSYKPYPEKKGQPVPFDHISSTLLTASGDPPGYYYVISDARDGAQSGTSIRQAFQDAGDDYDKQVAAYRRFYGPKVNDDILDLLVSKIKMIKKPKPKKKDEAEEPAAKKVKENEAELKESFSKADLFELQTQLIEMLPNNATVEIKAQGCMLTLPKRLSGPIWIIPKDDNGGLYYGTDTDYTYNISGLRFDGPRSRALLNLKKFLNV